MDRRPVALVPVTAYEPTRPTPAAIVSGEVAAHDAPHPLSVFDMFRIGIGPSSSHTVGPMRAGLAFTTELTTRTPPSRITIDLFGSLGATGRGHSTDRAVLLGLAGYDPETVDIATVEAILPTLASTGTLTLPSGTRVPLSIAEDIRFAPRTVLPYHVNALTITATGEDGDTILQRTYYSVGGGFVMLQTNDDPLHPDVSSLASSQASVGIDVPASYPFASSAQLLAQCQASGLSVAELVRANEEAVRPRDTVNAYLDRIADTMFDCVDAGTSAAGILPGGLDVPRRARALAGKLAQRLTGIPASPMDSMDEAGASSSGRRAAGAAWASTTADPMRAMDWVNLFALAVNEENAAGHRVVTAPTNGAAGVIPAVLGYLVTHCPETGSMPGVATGPATQDGARAAVPHPYDAAFLLGHSHPRGGHGFLPRGPGLVRRGVRGAAPRPRARLPAGRDRDRRPHQDERVHRGRGGRLPGRGRVGLGDGGRRPSSGAGWHPAAGGERRGDRDGTLAGADL